MIHPTTLRAATTMRFLRVGLAAALLSLVAAAAQARHHHDWSGRQAAAGQFDYYVLSLSWAPTYCLTHAQDRAECAGRGYGFVLHGLWPQYDEGGYPENCPTEADLSGAAVALGRTVYPSERLMRHEWHEHGTCSGLNPSEYFKLADRATAVLKIPAALDAPEADQRLTAERIFDLFQRANPQLPGGALTLACSRGSLSEVRVCLTRELAVRRCGRKVHSSCPLVALRVPASR